MPIPDFSRYMLADRTVAGQLKPPSSRHTDCSHRCDTSGTSCLGPWLLLCRRSPRFDRHREETSVPILLICWAGCELTLKGVKMKKYKVKVKGSKVIELRANGRNNSQQCWELFANNVASVCTGPKVCPVSNFAQQHATISNNMQQGVQTDATCSIQQCWELLVNNVTSVCTQPNN